MRAVVAAVVVLVAAVVAAAAEVAPVVSLEEGSVSGILEKSTKGKDFYSYYGIPFALPPVGKLRFKDPVPAERWVGTRDGSVPPPACLQLDHAAFSQAQSPTEEHFYGQEDCLYLNVFTPRVVHERRPLPVMVWIHGGGFLRGGAHQHFPHVLLNHDIVLVVIQYRLGILGFLSTEDSVITGNFGLKDQTLALQWVQRNIYHFGGDRSRVTIFGESTGGAAVHYQMLTPKAEGLFSRAILQSGSALCPWARYRSHRETAFTWADNLGCPTDRGTDIILDCLQGIHPYSFLPLQFESTDWYITPLRTSVVVDGDYLPDEPARLLQEGRFAHVDIMAGVTKDEGFYISLGPLSVRRLREELATNFTLAGPSSVLVQDASEDPVCVASEVYQHYLGTTAPTEAHAESLTQMFGDRFFKVCQDLTAASHARVVGNAKKTFRYELEHRAEISYVDLFRTSYNSDWVSHYDDLFYLFCAGAVLQLPSVYPECSRDLRRRDDLAVRDIMTSLWTNFAATGNPTPDYSLGFTWEPSTHRDLQYLALTPTPSMKPDNRQEVRRFHSSLPTPENCLLHPDLVEDAAAGHSRYPEL